MSDLTDMMISVCNVLLCDYPALSPDSCFLMTPGVTLPLRPPHRPKSTPTPTASLSANGVPSEAVDYDRLKQVNTGNMLNYFCH